MLLVAGGLADVTALDGRKALDAATDEDVKELLQDSVTQDGSSLRRHPVSTSKALEDHQSKTVDDKHLEGNIVRGRIHPSNTSIGDGNGNLTEEGVGAEGADAGRRLSVRVD
jgi:hypothetical protein